MERNNLFNRVCGRKAQTAANRIGWLAAMTVLVFGLLLAGCQYESNALGSAGKSLALSKGAVGEPAVTLGPVPISGLAAFLHDLDENDADDPYDIEIATANISDNNNWAAINTAVASAQAGGKYVIIDISLCSATDNTIAGNLNPTGNAFNIIQGNEFIVGVVLPDSVVTIGNYALCNCVNVTSVTIGDNVTGIGTYAFFGSGLTSVVVPDSVQKVDTGVFNSCKSLVSATIGSGVTSVGASFDGCSSLTTLTIREGPTPGVTVFGGHDAFYGTQLTTVTLPSSIYSLEDWTFWGVSTMTSVVVKDGVGIIKQGAFSQTSVAAVTFYGSSTVIDSDSAFPSGADLRALYASKGAGNYTLSGGAWSWTALP